MPRAPHTVVIGSGVAGLTTALAVGSATVFTKGSLGADGSSDLAQGGIAAPIGAGDSPASHAADTVAVSAGLGEPGLAEVLTEAAADRIAWLVELGAAFDRGPSGALTLGQEAGHSARRIIHADGDATGTELMRTLRGAVRARDDIAVVEHATAIDLIRDQDGVVGVLAADAAGNRMPLLADATVIATGGIGRLYSRTTNPAPVTGDGIAMAARAGATLIDLEFVQFHPTALAAGDDPMPLLTEALRGEGATLVDDQGARFMPAVHPDAELAPRDVVARAIWDQLVAGHAVYLDATSLGGGLPDRFPTVFGLARVHGLDPRRDLLPVSPAAHYFMGGIDVDDSGRTSLPGLWTVGEASSSGLHGANRLASNSLLEGLVFGGRAAAAIAASGPRPLGDRLVVPRGATHASLEPWEDLANVRRLMWEKVGIVRHAAGLGTASKAIDALSGGAERTVSGRNATLVAMLIARTALARTESRGGHHRSDHPAPNPAMASRRRVTHHHQGEETLDLTSEAIRWAS